LIKRTPLRNLALLGLVATLFGACLGGQTGQPDSITCRIACGASTGGTAGADNAAGAPSIDDVAGRPSIGNVAGATSAMGGAGAGGGSD
jgi:hypothetical protein